MRSCRIYLLPNPIATKKMFGPAPVFASLTSLSTLFGRSRSTFRKASRVLKESVGLVRSKSNGTKQFSGKNLFLRNVLKSYCNISRHHSTPLSLNMGEPEASTFSVAHCCLSLILAAWSPGIVRSLEKNKQIQLME